MKYMGIIRNDRGMRFSERPKVRRLFGQKFHRQSRSLAGRALAGRNASESTPKGHGAGYSAT
jgi:hypothetical protein